MHDFEFRVAVKKEVASELASEQEYEREEGKLLNDVDTSR